MNLLPSLVAGVLIVATCSPTQPTTRPVVAVPATRQLALQDLLSQPADVTLTLRPPAIVRDGVYGPLLRKASALAAAYAGPRTLGTTALVALERTEEVDAATCDSGEAVVLLLGVPADVDVTQVVDELGHLVWKPAQGDVRQSFVEYEAANGSDASLFVLPQRTWIVSAGPSRARTREALIETPAAASFELTGASLAQLSIRGGALVRRDERLRTGVLAPLGRSLVRASLVLTPGVEGVIVASLSYADVASAAGAEQTTREVVSAFRHRLEQLVKSADRAPSPSGQAPLPGVDHAPAPCPDGARAQTCPRSEMSRLSWLAAAGVERTSTTVNVRAPIPKTWLAAISQADVSLGQDVDHSGATDVPWALWRRSASPPTLSLPSAGDPE